MTGEYRGNVHHIRASHPRSCTDTDLADVELESAEARCLKPNLRRRREGKCSADVVNPQIGLQSLQGLQYFLVALLTSDSEVTLETLNRCLAILVH